MEEVFSESGVVAPSAPRAGVADQATWDRYYREAAKRRRQQASRHPHRVAKRKRLRRERIGLLLSALLVGGLTFVFYLVLTR